MEMRKLASLSGIVFVALIVIAIPLLSSDSPSSTTAVDEVVGYYKDHNAQQFVASLLIAASTPFLVLFALAISEWRSHGGARTTWDRMLVGGSFITAAVLLVVATTNFALADGADNGASSSALQALNLIVGDAWLGFNSGLGVLMLGAAGTFLAPGRAGWRSLGWTALVLGVALFIPYADFFALLLSGVWIVVAGVIASRAGAAGYRVAPGIA